MLQRHRDVREEHRRRRPLLGRIRLDLRGEHPLPVGVVQLESPLRVGSERNEEKLHTIPLSVWHLDINCVLCTVLELIGEIDHLEQSLE